MSILRDTEHYLEVSRGNIPGQRFLQSRANNPDIDIGTVPEDVWDGGGIYPGFTATLAQIIDIVSTSALDTLLGLGARSVFIEGLDINYNEISEVVNLNGTTPVSTVNTYLRVNFFLCITGGASAFVNGNVGTITATQTTSGILMQQINPGNSTARNTAFTVPADKDFFIINTFGSYNTTDNDVIVVLSGWVRPFGGIPLQALKVELNSSAGVTEIPNTLPIPLPAKADSSIRVIEAESDNADVSIGTQGVLINR